GMLYRFAYGYLINRIRSRIKLHKAVQTNSINRGQQGPCGDTWLHTSRCTYPHNIKAGVVWLWTTGLQIYIDKRIQLIHEDFNIISPHACADHAQALSFVPPGMGDKFTSRDHQLHLIKVP